MSNFIFVCKLNDTSLLNELDVVVKDETKCPVGDLRGEPALGGRKLTGFLEFFNRTLRMFY